MADQDELKTGVAVSWNTSQGRTRGRVVKKLTEPCQIENFQVQASSDDPRYLVRSDKTGQKAAHKAEALRLLKRRHTHTHEKRP